MINRLYIITLLSLFSYLGNAQEIYTIENIGTEYTEDQINDAMAGAEWCGYFFSETKRLLKFGDGTVVALKSAQELSAASVEFDDACISTSTYADNNSYLIHSSGRIFVEIKKESEMKYDTGKN